MAVGGVPIGIDPYTMAGAVLDGSVLGGSVLDGGVGVLAAVSTVAKADALGGGV